MDPIIEYLQIDRFDPDVEFDYKPLKHTLKEIWASGTNKEKAVQLLDDLADIGEIDDPDLAAMFATSYEEGIEPHSVDETLGKCWRSIANGSFSDVYEMYDYDVSDYESILTTLRLCRFLSMANDLRAIRTYVPSALLFAQLLNNMFRDTGDVNPNRAAYYSVEAIIWSKKLQDEQIKGQCPPEIRDIWFNEDNLSAYRQQEADGWFERGRAYRFKYLESDNNYSYRSASITSMKNAAKLGNLNAGYFFPALLMRQGTDEQITEAVQYAHLAVCENPIHYLEEGDKAGLSTNDSEIGTDVVCLIAQCYAEGIYGLSVDYEESHRLFEAADTNGSEWAKEALSHFKKSLLGGWKYQE